MAAVYLGTAWLLVEIVSTVGPMLDLPMVFQRGVLLLLMIGFPVALVLAWAFDLTPDGIRRDSGELQQARGSRSRFDYVVVGVLAAALAYFVADRFWWSADHQLGDLEASIAVLPFTNMTRDAGNDPFIDGIHDDLLTQLSRISSLRTTSRTSVLQYENTTKTVPQIAAELGVATILEAGVQRSGDRVRINVQLIDATTDEHLWAERYDRELTAANVFEIQSEIAVEIAAQLQAALTDDERTHLAKIPTQNLAALDAYFIGKQLLEERNLQSIMAAAEYFEKVVDLDPEFALGWSGLADANMLLPEYSSTVDRAVTEARAREAVQNALHFDPDLPEVRATQAWYELRFYDWVGAEQIFRDALAVAPDNTNVLHWLSHVLAWQGVFDEAIIHARHAADVDPDSNIMGTNLAYILVDAGQFDEGLAIARARLEAAPEHIVQLRNLYLHELRARQPAAAAQTFVRYTRQIGGDPEAAAQIGEMFVAYANDGVAGAISDDLIARTQLGSEDLAQILAFVGDAEETITALQVAAAENSGSRSVFSMKINPAYDFIRDDPRFQALLEQVGLAD